MASSLDKSTKKLKNNLLDYEREIKAKEGLLVNITKVNNMDKTAQHQMNHSKRFIAEHTNEVLIVSQDGCCVQKIDNNGNPYLQRLMDIREILGRDYSSFDNKKFTPIL